MTEQTKLLSVLNCGSSLDTNDNEIEHFLEILMITRYVNTLSCVDSWIQQLVYPKIADVMSLTSFQKLG